MIVRFRHKGIGRLFERGDPSGVNPQFATKLRRMIVLLDNGASQAALDLPGYRLHQLKGDRKGQWAALGPGDEVLEAGIVAQPKASKPAEVAA